MKTIHYNPQEFDTAISLALRFNPAFKDFPRSVLEQNVLAMIDKFKTNENVTLVNVAGITIEAFSRVAVGENDETLYLAFSFDVSLLSSLTDSIATANSSNSLLPTGLIQDEV